MQTDIRHTMLTEWAKLKQELAAVEVILKSRGWMPDSETDLNVTGISYIDEARAFISEHDDLTGYDFTSAAFIKHLHEKHGDLVNDASARGVFRVLESEGLIITKTPSKGRTGAIYTVVPAN